MKWVTLTLVLLGRKCVPAALYTCFHSLSPIYQCDTETSIRLIQILGGWANLKLELFILALANGRKSHETPKYSNMALRVEPR